MTTLHLKNIRSITEAELTLPEPKNVLLLASRNGQGKTSTAMALAALLMRDGKIVGRTKEERKRLMVGPASDQAVAVLSDGEARLRLIFPDAELEQKGSDDALPRASTIACGLVRPAELAEKDRAALFIDLLKAEPNEQDWLSACNDAGVPEDAARAFWKQEIAGTTGSWDRAHRSAESRAKEAKGRWCEVTGSRAWGKDKSASWLPQFWSDDLADATEDSLQAAVTSAKGLRDAAIAKRAISDEERAKLEETATDETRRAAQVGNEESQLQNTMQELAALGTEAGGDIMVWDASCPHCGAEVAVSHAGVLHKPEDKGWKGEEHFQKQITRRRQLTQYQESVKRDLERSRIALQAAKEAKEKLKTIGKAASKDELVAADGVLQEAQNRLGAWKTKTRADTLHNTIMQLEVFKELAGPGGVRKRKIDDALGLFNDRLAALCKKAGFETVKVHPEDLSVTLGGRSYAALWSRGRCWMVNSILALALAERDGSQMVILDDLDVVQDVDLRNGIFGAIMRVGLPTVLCLAVDQEQSRQIPKLAKHGIGAEMWIEDGHIMPVRHHSEERKAA